MNTLIDLIPEALLVGDDQRPTALIQAVEILKTHEVLTSLEPPHEPFTALTEDSSGCEKLRYAPKAITDAERAGLLQLLRWTMRELSTWSATNDTNGTTLDSIFVVLQMLHFREEHWNLLPTDRTANIEVRDRLVQLLSKSTITLSAGPSRRHRYEQGIVDKIKQADEELNWVELGKSWRSIAEFLRPSLLFSQGVLYLARYYPDKLLNLVDQKSQMSVAWLFAKQLSIQSRIHLAKESTSLRFQFAALLSIDGNDLVNRQLPGSASVELTQLLVQAAQKPALWRSWMKVFNEHPARFPWLQVSLGKALAQMSDASIIDYVDAIHLYPWPFGHRHSTVSSQPNDRSCVGVCLHQFRADADDTKQKALWSRAYERWSAWDFGSKKQPLMRVCYSELDYALVGHALECLTPVERLKHIEKNISRVKYLEGEWHASITSLLDARSRLFSQIQPLLVAEQKSIITWLSNSPHLPQDYTESEYSRSRFSV